MDLESVTDRATHSAEALDYWRAAPERGDAELDLARPWALPIVVRVEKVIPDGEPAPDHRGTVEAAARGVAMLLLHPDSAPGGPWNAALARWRAGRIRKITRRARGIRWREACAEPGVTVRVNGAEARVLPANPVDEPPAWLNKLQVGGLDLDRAPAVAERADPRGAPVAPVLTVLLAPGVSMTTGKAAAQAGHATQLAVERLDRDTVLAWAAAGYPVDVVDRSDPPDPRWAGACAGTIAAAAVRDGGLTEVAPGTRTAAATFAR